MDIGHEAGQSVGQERLSRALGWFSVAIGGAELLAPRRLTQWIGAPSSDNLIRAMGLREIASGVGILVQDRPAGWMHGRVAGDLMDLVLLGAAAGSQGANRARLALAGAAVGGVTALDIFASRRLADGDFAHLVPGPLHLVRSIYVNRPPEVLYGFWRSFENLPRFMKHLASVTQTSTTRSRWAVVGPLGRRIKWESEVTEDRVNELIAWRTVEEADIRHSGSVRFESRGGRGTLVTVAWDVDVPGGRAVAQAAAMLGQSPLQQLEDGLHRFQQLMETGEIATTEGQPAGRASSTVWYDRAVS